MGVFATILTELAAQAQETEIVMINAIHAKAHRTASSLAVQKGRAGGGSEARKVIIRLWSSQAPKCAIGRSSKHRPV